MKILQKILIIVVALCIAWGVYFVVSRQGAAIESQDTTSSNSQSEEPKEAPPPPPLYDAAALEASLQAIIAKYPLIETGISVQATSEDITTNIQDAEYIAASTTKAIVATYTLQQVERGVISLDGTIRGVPVRELITRMIVDSDNNAWYALLEYFGYSKFTAFGDEIGAPSFEAVANTISPNDMATFLKNMHKGSIINNEHVLFLEGLMAQAYTGPIKLDASYAALIRKAGWLEDRIHLVGIITNGDKSVSYAIYTKSANGGGYPSYASGSTMINEILGAITSALQ